MEWTNGTQGSNRRLGREGLHCQRGSKFSQEEDQAQEHTAGYHTGGHALDHIRTSLLDTGDYWSDESGSDDTSKESASLAAGSQADSEESKLIKCSGCVKVTTAKKVGGMHVFKKPKLHARACKILAARHCGPCERCLQVSIDCMPADSGSYKVKCKPCNCKSHPPCHHKFWLDQSLVAKWDGLVSQGKAHVVADVMVYGSSAVFGHPQYDKGYRASPQRPEPLQSNINSAYRSIDIAKGTDAEAALERISTAAKGLVEHFGINNCSEESKEEACLEALEGFCHRTCAEDQDRTQGRVSHTKGVLSLAKKRTKLRRTQQVTYVSPKHNQMLLPEVVQHGHWLLVKDGSYWTTGVSSNTAYSKGLDHKC
ncbi:uncharacterized protein UHO2_00969 [Ustilago hordei]|uniref:uncharacterized protein n=1 Tax=Ustilago hordei TaxID=120017 RepID=UPI001A5F293F|nr:uncharacterized protein UHO2_00969 [Ustilago hordei]SYW74104.1 uncharacterized protein UHO2_00969 [Ustilago hordei]